MTSGPLAGLRILDLTSVLMGPYASQLLAEMGADVIKVEAPGGDIVRQVGKARHPGMSGLFLTANRGKRSAVLDLKSVAGKADLLTVAATCDVLLYNVRPQAMVRLGLSYDVLAAANPALIYAGVFGYGEDGPYAGKPAYDDLIQGASGVASLFQLPGGDGEPRYIPMAIADRIVGGHAVGCILAALRHRDRTGRGQRLDVPMFETMVSIVLGDHLAGLTFVPPLDAGGYARLLARDRRPQRTSDGHICALIYNDKHWHKFFAALGRTDATTDPRYRDHGARTTHIAAIYAELAEIFLTRTSREWIDLLTAADIPVMSLHDLDSLLDDPHLNATGFLEMLDHPTEGKIRGMRLPSRWSDSQPSSPRPAPSLGEHTAEVLAEARALIAGREP